MNIVIIEDEQLTIEDLSESILRALPSANIVKTLDSVKTAIEYFKKNQTPDLIFSDIQLGDGLSFEVFKTLTITVPVIFCTAYDEYALNAFRANGIDYIVKPYTLETIAEALNKFKELKKSLFPTTQYEAIFELFESKKNNKQASVLVHYQDKILPVKLEEIALFYIENEITHLITFDRKTYSIGQTLGELEKITGSNFYRVSRQYHINRMAIKDASHYFSRKLSINLTIPFDETITVGKVKITEFLDWLSGT